MHQNLSPHQKRVGELTQQLGLHTAAKLAPYGFYGALDEEFEASENGIDTAFRRQRAAVVPDILTAGLARRGFAGERIQKIITKLIRLSHQIADLSQCRQLIRGRRSGPGARLQGETHQGAGLHQPAARHSPQIRRLSSDHAIASHGQCGLLHQGRV